MIPRPLIAALVFKSCEEVASWPCGGTRKVRPSFSNSNTPSLPLEAMAEQLMPGQLAGWRRAVGGEVGRRGGGHEALPARSDGDGDHVLARLSS